MEKALTDEGLSYPVYDKTSANPTTDNGEEAVRLGLIDTVGGLSDGLQCLYRQIDRVRGTGE